FDSIAGYSIPDHSYEAHCMTRTLLCEKRRMYEQKIYPLLLVEIVAHNVKDLRCNVSASPVVTPPTSTASQSWPPIPRSAITSLSLSSRGSHCRERSISITPETILLQLKSICCEMFQHSAAEKQSAAAERFLLRQKRFCCS